MQEKEFIVSNLIGIWQEKEITKPLPAEGRSMYPLIRKGDNIYIKFCKPDKLRVGDVIAFRRGTVTIVHRLIKILDSGFLEKGDLQIQAQSIEVGCILGKAVIAEDSRCKVPLTKHGINYILSLLGYTIHTTRPIKLAAKLLLLIPFIINTFIPRYRGAPSIFH